MKFFGNDAISGKIEKLKRVPVFRELSRKEILAVDELLHERIYDKDETIFEEGEVGHGIFIILEGKVQVKSSRSKLLQAAAPEFGPGDMLGELCLFDEAPRNATAVTIERTQAVALFQAELSSLLMRNNSIGVKVLLEISRTMSRRVRRLLSHELDLPSV